MLLTKQAIVDVKDYETKDIYIEEWGGDVRIKTFSTETELELDKLNEKGIENTDIAIFLIIRSCVDENNELLFDAKNEDDIKALKNKCSSSLIKLYKEIIKLNNKEESSVDDLAKN